MPRFGTVASVKAAVPDATFKRAREIVTSAKLQNVLFEGDSLQKGTALCEGSNPGDNYKVAIIVELNSSAPPSGHCTCPAAARALCKHAVALLLKRVEEATKLEQASGEGSTNGDASTLKQEKSSPSVEATAVKVKETAALEEPRVVQSVEVLALYAEFRILPAWMTKSAKEKEEDEKPAKRVAAPRKPPPAPKRTRGRTTKLEDDEVEDEPVPSRRGIQEEDEASKRVGGRRRGTHEEEVEELVDNGVDEESEDREAEEEFDSVPQHRHRRLRRRNNVKRQDEEEEEVCPSPLQKRDRRRRVEQHEESDLSDKVVATDKAINGPNAALDLDLTGDDLLRYAQEHLNGDTEMKDGRVELIQEAQAPERKKKSSIFSSSQWRESQNYPIATSGEAAKAVPTATMAIPAIPHTRTTQASGDILNDMLGTFLPTLKGESGKVSSISPDTAWASTRDTVMNTDSTRMKDEVSGIRDEAYTAYSNETTEVEPKPKKKSSLKDRVQLYL